MSNFELEMKPYEIDIVVQDILMTYGKSIGRIDVVSESDVNGAYNIYDIYRSDNVKLATLRIRNGSAYILTEKDISDIAEHASTKEEVLKYISDKIDENIANRENEAIESISGFVGTEIDSADTDTVFGRLKSHEISLKTDMHGYLTDGTDDTELTIKGQMNAYKESLVSSTKDEFEKFAKGDSKDFNGGLSKVLKDELDRYTEEDKTKELDEYAVGTVVRKKVDDYAETAVNKFKGTAQSELNEHVGTYDSTDEATLMGSLNKKKADIEGVYQSDLATIASDCEEVKSRIKNIKFSLTNEGLLHIEEVSA